VGGILAATFDQLAHLGPERMVEPPQAAGAGEGEDGFHLSAHLHRRAVMGGLEVAANRGETGEISDGLIDQPFLALGQMAQFPQGERC